MSEARRVLGGTAQGAVLATAEPLSFWGGIDPATARVMDVHHPLHGADVAGRILAMPTTRGSCTGSGVLLDLALSGRAPAALVFREPEDVVTLGALIAAELFGRQVPVLRLAPDAFAAVAAAGTAEITETAIRAGGRAIPSPTPPPPRLRSPTTTARCSTAATARRWRSPCGSSCGWRSCRAPSASPT